MKKMLLSLGLMLTLCAGSTLAQAPSCNNDNGLEGRIDAIEAGGWVELSRSFSYVYYFAEPEPPYLIGTLSIVFGVACDPGEPCPQIAKIYQEDAVQVSQNSCVWQPVNQQQ